MGKFVSNINEIVIPRYNLNRIFMLYKLIADKDLAWDYKVSYGCVLYFIMSVLNATIKTIFPDSGIVSGMSLLSGLVIALGFAQCLKAVFRRNKNIFISVYFLFFAIYSLSFILISLRGENTDIMIRGSAFLTFCWWIPIGVFTASVYDKKILYNIFLKSSYIILFLLTLMFIYHPLPENGVAGYNIFFGFNMLIPALFHINEFFKRKRTIFLLLFIIEFIMIFIYANRGCLLPIAFIIIYKLFFESKKRTAKYFPIILLLTAIIVIFGNSMIQFIAGIFESYGISSRTLWLIMSGEISNSTGRDDIWKHCFEMIRERPLLGWGLGGEFYQLAAYDGALEIDNSFHPHNGVIQNFVNFGVLGGIISTFIIIRSYLGMKRIKDNSYHDLVLIFGSAIIAMFYSSSGFFTNPMAAIFLFLSYSYRNKYVRTTN